MITHVEAQFSMDAESHQCEYCGEIIDAATFYFVLYGETKTICCAHGCLYKHFTLCSCTRVKHLYRYHVINYVPTKNARKIKD